MGGAFWETSGTGDELATHVELIREQVRKSLEDHETRLLAVAIVSGAYDLVEDAQGRLTPAVPYHGRYYRVEPSLCAARDERCELTMLWNFWVRNVRYLQDQIGEDTYPTLEATLEAGGEDCDGFTIGLAALAGAIGYHSIARVISVDGRSWDHIYPVIRMRNGRLLPLDATERGWLPGQEYSRPRAKRDFPLV